MIDALTNWIDYFFLFTCILTILLFYQANGKRMILLIGMATYLCIQSLLAYFGFYQITNSSPPRVIFVMFPFIALLFYGLLPRQLNTVISYRNINTSTYLHSIRILVEIVLYYLYVHKMIPELMTFAGRNFDILAGLTAPIIAYLYQKKKISDQVLLIWNVIALGLVLFILINGVLSAQTPLQRFAFDQPNRAILYFPYVLLPSIIVPIVIYSHLTDILILYKKQKNEKRFPTRN